MNLAVRRRVILRGLAASAIDAASSASEASGACDAWRVREDRFGVSTRPSKSSFFLGGDQHIGLEEQQSGHIEILKAVYPGTSD